MQSFWAMVLANLKMTVRNRQALFWNLAFPAIFILIFGAVFDQDEGVSFDVGIAGAESPYREAVVAALEESDSFDLHVGDQDEELDQLRDSDRQYVLVFGEQPAGQDVAPVQVYYDEAQGPNGQVGLTILSQVMTQAAGGENRLPITTQPIESLAIDYIDFFVPGILAMSLMNSGMIGLASAFVTYREKGILRRIRATPFPLSSFIAARILSQLVTSVMQAVILIGLGMLLFDLSITGNIMSVLLMVILGSLAFLSLGFVISAFARNQEAADSLANALSFPMLFLGGVFFPVDSAPEWLQPLMRIIPLRYLVDGLREIMVRGATLSDVWLDIVIMLATGAVGFMLALRFFRWESSAA
jgi:ABC-2 type transport system permease protein